MHSNRTVYRTIHPEPIPQRSSYFAQSLYQSASSAASPKRHCFGM